MEKINYCGEARENLTSGTLADESETTTQCVSKKSFDIDVDNVANLAKLKLTQEEKISMKSELMAIIDFADKLAEIDTQGGDITAHIVTINNVFRNDEVTNKSNRDELLANAPTKVDGYMTVPKTVE